MSATRYAATAKIQPLRAPRRAPHAPRSSSGGAGDGRIGDDVGHAQVTCSRQRVARRKTSTSTMTSAKLITDIAADSPM